MRVLFVPELYRPDDATANGTLNDAVALVEQWLDIDPNLHVYWLLAPPETANYDHGYVLADRERVTLVEAEPFMHGHEHEDAFSETGYTEDQFRAIEETIFDVSGYVDVAIDQQVTGRYDLSKWLHRLGGGPAAEVRPTEVVGYVHDLRLPFKRHGREMPDDAPVKVELSAATYADGLWFKAGVDAERMREYGTAVLDEAFLDDLLDDALETGSPLDFGEYEESYADDPERLHVAGSGWGKKNLDVVLDAAETLHEEFGIRTLMTNMDPIPEGMADREFVDAYPECSRERYETALRTGDIAVCASDHETMPRTPFEQAASGQVLVVRDEPWAYDCVPEDYRLAGDLGDLEALAVRTVENWDEAVAENRRMVERVREVRGPERCGRRTHRDLAQRVERRISPVDGTAVRDDVATAASEFDGEIPLDDLRERAGEGTPISDLVYALRSLGYADAGNPGTPVFVASG
ncbi:glycosyltransferase [Halorussus sp. MSC15.2]|uniref:glycosyltransferase n=1 Tax=Halorussus sp. MSC15.2 TaxID=2283638 RepID=UPI0013CFE99F|nr:glycosyltransferase [Halorussus sp. MSC15.2]NEU55999.1 glycosyltransferase [Halorussus sp. MSC15.2]